MNGRQAAKLASKRIEELENYMRLAKRDIKAYNRVILDIIEGTSPCEWCEDKDECDKKNGNGCHDWMLTFKLGQEEEKNECEDDNPEGLPEESGICGT